MEVASTKARQPTRVPFEEDASVGYSALDAPLHGANTRRRSDNRVTNPRTELEDLPQSKPPVQESRQGVFDGTAAICVLEGRIRL